MEENTKDYLPFGAENGTYYLRPEVFILRNEGALKVLELLEAEGKEPSAKCRRFCPPLVYIDEAVPANSPEVSKRQQRLLALCDKFELPFYYGKGNAYWDAQGSLWDFDVVGLDADVLMVGGEGNMGRGFCISPEDMAELLTCEDGLYPMERSLMRKVSLLGALPGGVDIRDAARALTEELRGQIKEKESLAFGAKEELAFGEEDGDPLWCQAEKILCGMMQKLSVRTAFFTKYEWVTKSPDFTFDLSTVKPSIDIGNGQIVQELSPQRVQAVWIGGAYGGTMKAMELTAKALKGKKVAPGVRLSVSPCTADVYEAAADRDYLTDIMEAGGLVLNQCASPRDQARIGDTELMISNDFHNEEGYAGGTIYLASTYKAIEAALTGWISLGNAEVPKTEIEEKAPREIRRTETPRPSEEAPAETPTVLTGRVWKFGDDIDTDIIIPTQHLSYADWAEVKRHMFEPLRPELAGQIAEGDIIVAGNNFGCGSSREQAAEVIATSGIRCIIAKSFARIFFRNAINNGVLLIECPDLPDQVEEGDTVEVVMGHHISHKGKTYPIPKMPENLTRLILAGGLVKSVMGKGLSV